MRSKTSGETLPHWGDKKVKAAVIFPLPFFVGKLHLSVSIMKGTGTCEAKSLTAAIKQSPHSSDYFLTKKEKGEMEYAY